jgi:hypothetical protein
MTDDDIPAPGRWREVVDFVRERGDSVFLRDVSSHFAIPSAYASRLLAQGVLGGKIHHQGPCKGLDCRQAGATAVVIPFLVSWAAVPCSSICGCVLVLLRFRRCSSAFLLQWSDACRVVALTGLPTS